jgi:rare lipoprotein A
MKSNSFIILVGVFLIGCSSSPRYLHDESTAKTSYGDYNRTTLLIKDVKHTAILSASFYGEEFHGKLTSNGEIFDMYGMTAAHKTLPFGTILKITYPATGKSVEVRINDRGPFAEGRDIDLSYGAASKIGLVKDGVGKVKVTVIKWGTDN